MSKGKSKKATINGDIQAKEVRLVGALGEQVGIVTIEEALEAAAAAKLDLVEIAPDAQPPVCKVMDYGKKLFDEKKQQAANRKKARQTQVKEISVEIRRFPDARVQQDFGILMHRQGEASFRRSPCDARVRPPNSL